RSLFCSLMCRVSCRQTSTSSKTPIVSFADAKSGSINRCRLTPISVRGVAERTLNDDSGLLPEHAVELATQVVEFRRGGGALLGRPLRGDLSHDAGEFPGGGQQ